MGGASDQLSFPRGRCSSVHPAPRASTIPALPLAPPPRRALTPNAALTRWLSSLQPGDSWHRAQFERKRDAYLAAASRDEITFPASVTPAQRAQATRAITRFRRDFERRIDQRYGHNPTFAADLKRRLGKMDVDHVIDLQLGGGNDPGNFRLLDRATNRGMGAKLGAFRRDWHKAAGAAGDGALPAPGGPAAGDASRPPLPSAPPPPSSSFANGGPRLPAAAQAAKAVGALLLDRAASELLRAGGPTQESLADAARDVVPHLLPAAGGAALSVLAPKVGAALGAGKAAFDALQSGDPAVMADAAITALASRATGLPLTSSLAAGEAWSTDGTHVNRHGVGLGIAGMATVGVHAQTSSGDGDGGGRDRTVGVHATAGSTLDASVGVGLLEETTTHVSVDAAGVQTTTTHTRSGLGVAGAARLSDRGGRRRLVVRDLDEVIAQERTRAAGGPVASHVAATRGHNGYGTVDARTQLDATRTCDVEKRSRTGGVLSPMATVGTLHTESGNYHVASRTHVPSVPVGAPGAAVSFTSHRTEAGRYASVSQASHGAPAAQSAAVFTGAVGRVDTTAGTDAHGARLHSQTHFAGSAQWATHTGGNGARLASFAEAGTFSTVESVRGGSDLGAAPGAYFHSQLSATGGYSVQPLSSGGPGGGSAAPPQGPGTPPAPATAASPSYDGVPPPAHPPAAAGSKPPGPPVDGASRLHANLHAGAGGSRTLLEGEYVREVSFGNVGGGGALTSHSQPPQPGTAAAPAFFRVEHEAGRLARAIDNASGATRTHERGAYTFTSGKSWRDVVASGRGVAIASGSESRSGGGAREVTGYVGGKQDILAYEVAYVARTTSLETHGAAWLGLGTQSHLSTQTALSREQLTLQGERLDAMRAVGAQTQQLGSSSRELTQQLGSSSRELTQQLGSSSRELTQRVGPETGFLFKSTTEVEWARDGSGELLHSTETTQYELSNHGRAGLMAGALAATGGALNELCSTADGRVGAMAIARSAGRASGEAVLTSVIQEAVGPTIPGVGGTVSGLVALSTGDVETARKIGRETLASEATTAALGAAVGEKVAPVSLGQSTEGIGYGRFNGYRIYGGVAKTNNAGVSVLPGVTVGATHAAGWFEYEKDGYIVRNDYVGAGSRASVLGALSLGSMSVSGKEVSSVRKRVVGEYVHHDNWEREFTGEQRIQLRAGNRQFMASLPAWSQRMRTHKEIRRADGKPTGVAVAGLPATYVPPSAPAAASASRVDRSAFFHKHLAASYAKAAMGDRAPGRTETPMGQDKDGDSRPSAWGLERHGNDKTYEVGVFTEASSSSSVEAQGGGMVVESTHVDTAVGSYKDLIHELHKGHKWYGKRYNEHKLYRRGERREEERVQARGTVDATVTTKADGSGLRDHVTPAGATGDGDGRRDTDFADVAYRERHVEEGTGATLALHEFDRTYGEGVLQATTRTGDQVGEDGVRTSAVAVTVDAYSYEDVRRLQEKKDSEVQTFAPGERRVVTDLSKTVDTRLITDRADGDDLARRTSEAERVLGGTATATKLDADRCLVKDSRAHTDHVAGTSTYDATTKAHGYTRTDTVFDPRATAAEWATEVEGAVVSTAVHTHVAQQDAFVEKRTTESGGAVVHHAPGSAGANRVVTPQGAVVSDLRVTKASRYEKAPDGTTRRVVAPLAVRARGWQRRGAAPAPAGAPAAADAHAGQQRRTEHDYELHERRATRVDMTASPQAPATTHLADSITIHGRAVTETVDDTRLVAVAGHDDRVQAIDRSSVVVTAFKDEATRGDGVTATGADANALVDVGKGGSGGDAAGATHAPPGQLGGLVRKRIQETEVSGAEDTHTLTTHKEAGRAMYGATAEVGEAAPVAGCTGTAALRVFAHEGHQQLRWDVNDEGVATHTREFKEDALALFSLTQAVALPARVQALQRPAAGDDKRTVDFAGVEATRALDADVTVLGSATAVLRTGATTNAAEDAVFEPGSAPGGWAYKARERKYRFAVTYEAARNAPLRSETGPTETRADGSRVTDTNAFHRVIDVTGRTQTLSAAPVPASGVADSGGDAPAAAPAGAHAAPPPAAAEPAAEPAAPVGEMTMADAAEAAFAAAPALPVGTAGTMGAATTRRYCEGTQTRTVEQPQERADVAFTGGLFAHTVDTTVHLQRGASQTGTVVSGEGGSAEVAYDAATYAPEFVAARHVRVSAGPSGFGLLRKTTTVTTDYERAAGQPAPAAAGDGGHAAEAPPTATFEGETFTRRGAPTAQQRVEFGAGASRAINTAAAMATRSALRGFNQTPAEAAVAAELAAADPGAADDGVLATAATLVDSFVEGTALHAATDAFKRSAGPTARIAVGAAAATKAVIRLGRLYGRYKAKQAAAAPATAAAAAAAAPATAAAAAAHSSTRKPPWLRAPTHRPSTPQWWSNPPTQQPHEEQWCAPGGRHSRHVLQKRAVPGAPSSSTAVVRGGACHSARRMAGVRAGRPPPPPPSRSSASTWRGSAPGSAAWMKANAASATRCGTAPRAARALLTGAVTATHRPSAVSSSPPEASAAGASHGDPRTTAPPHAGARPPPARRAGGIGVCVGLITGPAEPLW